MKTKIRCAIYTRKSSEEGLEQAFNSLDAQREACEAYIRSQRHEGWLLAPGHYDDGGFSGGSMERPALQQLLRDIAARGIDVVVVYKVDRLTRALTDFARIIDIFDRHGVSFVSVTQQFSTTTSMGRLTLNMLLSFAQFEREVTGERIRDKIAASKRKGMWMGGLVPLGYERQERTLVINEAEAETVRAIFRIYLELGCVRRLKDEVDREGLRSKSRSRGRSLGGLPFTRGHLYRILSNPLYIGEIAHKGETYPGQHPAIIARETWEAVQATLAANRQGHQRRESAAEASLLAGLLFAADGERLTPSHANKGGRRYRYYVSHGLIDGSESGSRLRIPAQEIETLVIDALQKLLTDEARMIDLLRSEAPHPQQRLDRARRLAHEIAAATGRDLLRAMIARITIGADEVQLALSSSGLFNDLGLQIARSEEPLSITVPAKLRHCRGAARLILAGGLLQPAAPDPVLVKLVARGHCWFARLSTGEAQSLGQIAAEEHVTSSYAARVLHLAFLAPDIIDAIIDGRQPPELTADRLFRALPLPLDWAGQRLALRFDRTSSA